MLNEGLRAAAIGIGTDGPAVRFGRARHATEVVGANRERADD
jgi:hypothetical protein